MREPLTVVRLQPTVIGKQGKQPHTIKCGRFCQHIMTGVDTAGRAIDIHGKLIVQTARKDLKK